MHFFGPGVAKVVLSSEEASHQIEAQTVGAGAGSAPGPCKHRADLPTYGLQSHLSHRRGDYDPVGLLTGAYGLALFDRKRGGRFGCSTRFRAGGQRCADV